MIERSYCLICRREIPTEVGRYASNASAIEEAIKLRGNWAEETFYAANLDSAPTNGVSVWSNVVVPASSRSWNVLRLDGVSTLGTSVWQIVSSTNNGVSYGVTNETFITYYTNTTKVVDFTLQEDQPFLIRLVDFDFNSTTNSSLRIGGYK